VAILSNSYIGTKNLEIFGVPIIYSVRRKPFNSKFVQYHFPNGHICFVGDRILTDCVLANLMGAMSILVKPVDPSSEPLSIRIMRRLENMIA